MYKTLTICLNVSNVKTMDTTVYINVKAPKYIFCSADI